jgi:hypothetical protein
VRLTRAIGAELVEARDESRATGQPARRFKELTGSNRKSWSRKRRVIAKAEWTRAGRMAPPRAEKPDPKPSTVHQIGVSPTVHQIGASPPYPKSDCPATILAARHSAITPAAISVSSPESDSTIGAVGSV